jgi:hypothetical protein
MQLLEHRLDARCPLPYVIVDGGDILIGLLRKRGATKEQHRRCESARQRGRSLCVACVRASPAHFETSRAWFEINKKQAHLYSDSHPGGFLRKPSR